MAMQIQTKISSLTQMRSLRYWYLALIIIAISGLCFVFQDYDHFWDYQKSTINNGEVWRLFSGHFSHTNGFHLLLNISALILLNAIHGQFYRIKTVVPLMVTNALIVSGGLYFTSDITHYVGLSGILHGLFIWGALKDIQNNEKTGVWLFLGIWLKVIYEQVSGPSNDVVQLIDANVAIDAHLWGAIAGSFYFVFSVYYRRFTNRDE